MANDCFTEIMIQSEDRETLHRLYGDLKKIYETDSWLRNIFDRMGLLEKYPETGLRGDVTDLWFEEDTEALRISEDTAWFPKITVWVIICEKYFGEGNYTLLYMAEECGNQIYLTNDPDMTDAYNIDCFCTERFDGDDMYESDYEASREWLCKYLRHFLARIGMADENREYTFEELDRLYHESDLRKDFIYNQYEYCNEYEIDDRD